MNSHFKILFFALTIMAVGYDAFGRAVVPSYTPVFNGNISAIVSRTFLTSDPQEFEISQYNFRYDALNRLTDADYFSEVRLRSSSAMIRDSDDFSIRNTSYDLHGNILGLQRFGITQKDWDNNSQTGLVDHLQFFYYGNRMTGVIDLADELMPYFGNQTYFPIFSSENSIAYEANGNLIFFPDLGITLTFDPALNKPVKVLFPDGETRIAYDALGNKISKVETVFSDFGTIETRRYYAGPVIQTSRSSGANPPTYSIHIEIGGGIFNQNGDYFIRFADYQGSVRVVVRASTNSSENVFNPENIVEVNNFDPWGVEFGRSQNPFGMQNVKHQDMERLNFGNMNVHNHGARWAFNALGRWLGMDPLMELFYSMSPYTFLGNNPVRFIDPDGRKALDLFDDAEREINREGRVVREIPSDTRDAFHMVARNEAGNYVRTGQSISFEHGTVTGSQRANLFRRNTSFDVINESAGADLFKFFADNTNVEFGLINTRDNISVVTTSHIEGSVDMGRMRSLRAEGKTITSTVHDHGVADWSTTPSRSDRNMARRLPNARHFIYQIGRNSLREFDGNNLDVVRPWGEVFSPSGLRILPEIPRHPGVGLSPP
ncbi:MAG: hypothetical protein FWC94_05235 [Bacteroidales bacterium]|nr:hypothetical protein [Bacteroidales bacterium]